MWCLEMLSADDCNQRRLSSERTSHDRPLGQICLQFLTSPHGIHVTMSQTGPYINRPKIQPQDSKLKGVLYISDVWQCGRSLERDQEVKFLWGEELSIFGTNSGMQYRVIYCKCYICIDDNWELWLMVIALENCWSARRKKKIGEDDTHWFCDTVEQNR